MGVALMNFYPYEVPIPILPDIVFFRLNTLKLYCDKSNGVILDFSTLIAVEILKWWTLKGISHPVGPHLPFFSPFLRNLDGAGSFFVFFFRVLQQKTRSNSPMDDEIRACKKETNFDTARQDTSQTFT